MIGLLKGQALSQILISFHQFWLQLQPATIMSPWATLGTLGLILGNVLINAQTDINLSKSNCLNLQGCLPLQSNSALSLLDFVNSPPVIEVNVFIHSLDL